MDYTAGHEAGGGHPPDRDGQRDKKLGTAVPNQLANLVRTKLLRASTRPPTPLSLRPQEDYVVFLSPGPPSV